MAWRGKTAYAGRFFLICAILMVGLTLGNILFGVLYDTEHFGDTLFVLGAGWRTVQGLTPVLDFGHFYGGVMAEGIAATMRLTGADAFAFERFTLLLLATLVLAATAILYRRMSSAGFLAVILTITVLTLTRYPLELDEAIIRVASTHSFIYNRYGLALFLISGLFVALRGTSDRSDMFPGLLVGVLVVLAALTKSTFVVLAPGVVLGLTLQGRWRALAGVCVGIGASVMLLDPGLQKWLGSLTYVQAQVADQASTDIGSLLRKAIQLPLSQPLATTLALMAVITLLWTRTHVAAVLGLIVVAAAGVGMETTMGGNGNLGQLALPVAILIALAAGEIAGRSRLQYALPMQMVAFAMVLAFSLPHLVNLASAMLEGVARRDQMLISEGPYARYLSVPDTEHQPGAATQYAMFADGIEALHALGDPSRWGIVADHGITFEHAVLGPAVPGYPLWQRVSAPELAADKPIAAEADLVMIGRSEPESEVGTILRAKLGDDFVFCTRSRYWEIHTRRTSGIRCTGE